MSAPQKKSFLETLGGLHSLSAGAFVLVASIDIWNKT